MAGIDLLFDWKVLVIIPLLNNLLYNIIIYILCAHAQRFIESGTPFHICARSGKGVSVICVSKVKGVSVINVLMEDWVSQ